MSALVASALAAWMATSSLPLAAPRPPAKSATPPKILNVVRQKLKR